MNNPLAASIAHVEIVLKTRSENPAHIRLPRSECASLLSRLARYLRAGIPLFEAMHLVRDETSRPHTRMAYRIMTDELSQGRTLADTLSCFPRSFTTLTVELVRIGEASGALHDYLAHAARLLREQTRIRRQVLGALLYPALIGMSTIAIAAFLALYAFPKMLPLLRGLHTTLPFPTRVLIAINSFCISYGWIVVLLLVIAFVCAPFVLRTPNVQRRLDALLLWFHVSRPFIQLPSIALLSDTLASLLRSGVRILPALTLASAAVRSPAYQDALRRISERIAHGSPLSDELACQPGLFPSYLVQLVRSGERTGTLPDSLQVAGERARDELEELTRTLGTLVEPGLMLLMGVLVGFVALAIIEPIYGITQNLGVK